jgi:hypothetical protein
MEAVWFNAMIPRRLVQANRLGLQCAAFKLHCRVAGLLDVLFKGGQQSSADPSASKGRIDVHPLDLGYIVSQPAKSPAGDWSAIATSDQETAAGPLNVSRLEVTDAVVIVALGEFLGQSVEKHRHVGKVDIHLFDDQVIVQ